jgi:hypothetical protein
VSEGKEQRLKARKLMTDAGVEYANSFDVTEGGIVTGYLSVFEIMGADGELYCVWITGDGSEPHDDERGALPAWRVDGLARKVIRDIDCRRVDTE